MHMVLGDHCVRVIQCPHMNLDPQIEKWLPYDSDPLGASAVSYCD